VRVLSSEKSRRYSKQAPDRIRKRLAEFGLIDQAAGKQCPDLGTWLQQYVDSRRDVVQSTKTHSAQKDHCQGWSDPLAEAVSESLGDA
jgi:hypothetical protein